MPLRDWLPTRRRSAMTLFTLAAVAAIAGVYAIFDIYLTSVSRELVSSWLQSEAVALEEGQLLGSITKNQRVLLSSQFVRGATLFDLSASPPLKLIEVGSKIDSPTGKLTTSDAQPEVERAGFFHKHVLYQIPNHQELLLVFDVESKFLQTFFYGTTAALLVFIIVLFGSIEAVERSESRKREAFLKCTLSDFIDQGKPSDFVESELPFLVNWWKQKKSEADRSKALAIENESKILLGELAARVAHDIRSPLNTINAVTSQLKNIPPTSESMLKDAVQRIRDIANSIGDRNRLILAQEKLKREIEPTAVSIIESSRETVLLFPILEETVSEKRVQHRQSSIEILCDITPAAYPLFASVNALELKRTLANLIENSIQAITGKGSVTVSATRKGSEVHIRIGDTGKGIPALMLARIGQKGFTRGKEGGTGLGVYYAKESVASWGGQFEIASVEGRGTTIGITLPVAQAPKWFGQEVSLSKDATLVILDDDSSIHAMWQDLIRSKAPDLRMEHFFDPQSAQSWFVQNRGKVGSFFVLSDYDLQAREGTGLDVIERMGLTPKDVMLVTSAFDDKSVRAKCEQLKIKILPKQVAAFTPVVVT